MRITFRNIHLGEIGQAARMKAAMSEEQWAALNRVLEMLDLMDEALMKVKEGFGGLAIAELVVTSAGNERLSKIYSHEKGSAEYFSEAGALLRLLA